MLLPPFLLLFFKDKWVTAKKKITKRDWKSASSRSLGEPSKKNVLE